MSRRSLVFTLAVVGFLATFAGYAFGVFSPSVGVLLVPVYAAFGSVIGACWIGYSKGGPVAAWLVAYTPMLAYHAEDLLLGSRGQTHLELILHLFHPAVLMVLGIQTMIIGTVAFLIGSLSRKGIHVFREIFGSELEGKGNL